MKTSKAADLTVASILVALAAVIAWESRRWPPASDFAGDPLILPRVLAALMCIAAVALALPALRQARAVNGSDINPESLDLKRAGLGIGATILFALALPWLGLIAAAVPFLLVLQRLAGASWRQALPAAVVTPIVIWLIFAVGLNVPLPSGILSPLLGR